MQAGVDTGGTFTDLVADDGSVVKVLSTPIDPAAAVGAALRGAAGQVEALAHGTTVATNALLEAGLARTALVTTAGIGDVIEIARQDRPSLYDHFADRPAPLVPAELRLEVPGRLAADGTELEPVGDVPEVPEGVAAVAVVLLHSDLDDSHEVAVTEVLEERGHDVYRSSAVSPEFREYERTVTTVINAGLAPRCRDYLGRVGALAERVSVMTSDGGLLDAPTASELPAALLLSGPAAGVAAGAAAAGAAGFADVVTFDMGGTSTDVCLVRDGKPAGAGGRTIGGYPVRLPALDIQTVGAGGGSVAWVDAGGALRVGPVSAGADPGPACYGRGGESPTVTDADLVCGRIPLGAAFGELTLDREAADQALDRTGIDPDGVLRVVDANMVRAIRAVSVERGVDASRLALLAFGGAGPLHACALATELGMAAVVVPPRAGVLSAVGLLTAEPARHLVRSWPDASTTEGLDLALATLAEEAGREVAGEVVEVRTALDCRYAGQSHELTVTDVAAFHDEHERRNGYRRPDATVEVVALRARAVGVAMAELADLVVPDHRRSFEVTDGPAVIAEPDCTVWVEEGWRAEPGGGGAIVMRRRS